MPTQEEVGEGLLTGRKNVRVLCSSWLDLTLDTGAERRGAETRGAPLRGAETRLSAPQPDLNS